MLTTVNKHHLNGSPHHFNVICNYIRYQREMLNKVLNYYFILPPNSINNTQRLEVLRSAFVQQSKVGVTTSFVQVRSYALFLGHKQVGNTFCSDYY